MQKFKHLIIALTVLLSGTMIAVPAIASADFTSDACAGVNSVDGASADNSSCSSSSGTTLSGILKVVINVLSIIVGVAAVIMIILSGMKFITSSGDSSKVGSARSSIMYAVIGLIIVVLAQVLVHFVLNRASSAATVCTKTVTTNCVQANSPVPKAK